MVFAHLLIEIFFYVFQYPQEAVILKHVAKLFSCSANFKYVIVHLKFFIIISSVEEMLMPCLIL
jgi:hypothetical protein